MDQRTTGPVSLTWVQRICWIWTNLEIQEQSMLYKLSPIQKHQEQIWPCHKNGQGQPSHHLNKKPQGMGIQPLGTSSGSILKLSLFPSFCTSSRKIPFFLIILYILFYFIHVYKAPWQEETTLGDNFFDASRMVLSFWSLVACFKKKIALPSDFMHIFSWFYTCT